MYSGTQVPTLQKNPSIQLQVLGVICYEAVIKKDNQRILSFAYCVAVLLNSQTACTHFTSYLRVTYALQ